MSQSKPPIGITPRWLLDEEREIEILDAIDRYQTVNYPVPMEWITELVEVQKRLHRFYGIYYDGYIIKEGAELKADWEVVEDFEDNVIVY